jgi:hypothetical protein
VKKETYRLTDRQIWMGLLFGKFKWYRKRKGGTWSLVEGFPYYWVNREPFDIEIKANQVFKVERYNV